jgi:hypothetical protein
MDDLSVYKLAINDNKNSNKNKNNAKKSFSVIILIILITVSILYYYYYFFFHHIENNDANNNKTSKSPDQHNTSNISKISNALRALNRWLPPQPEPNIRIIHDFCKEGQHCKNSNCMYYHPIEWKYYFSDYSNYPTKYLKIYHQDIQTLTHDWPKPTHRTSKNLKMTDYNCL